MHTMGYTCFLQIVLLVAVSITCSLADRTLSEPQFNPDCAENNSLCSDQDPSDNVTLSNIVIVTRSQGPKDTFYFLWSTIGVPSLLFLQTEPGANVSLDWDSMHDPAIQVPSVRVSDGQILSSAGYLLPNVWNCTTSDDPDDPSLEIPMSLSDCQTDDILHAIPLDNLQWDDTSHLIEAINGDAYQFVLRSQDKTTFKGGELVLTITLYGSDGRNEVLLPMLHTENTTQFEVTLGNLPGTDMSRYAFTHSYLLPTASAPVGFKSTRGLDDEETPGVFKYQELDATSFGPDSNDSTFPIYFGWKQAGYSDTKLDLADIIPLDLPSNMDDLPVTDSMLGVSVAGHFFTEHYGGFSAVSFNMTFGTNKKDDGYQGLLAWNGQLGLGSPSYDGVSALIIGITITGVVIPVAVIVFGMVFVRIMKKRRSGEWSPNGDSAINDDRQHLIS